MASQNRAQLRHRRSAFRSPPRRRAARAAARGVAPAESRGGTRLRLRRPLWITKVADLLTGEFARNRRQILCVVFRCDPPGRNAEAAPGKTGRKTARKKPPR